MTRAAMAGAAFAAACAGRAAPPTIAANATAAGHELALFRGGAAVRQLVDVDAPAAGPVSLRVAVARDADPAKIAIAERGGLAGVSVHAADGARVSIEAVAPHAGHYALVLAYETRAVDWDASYTLATTPAHDRAVLRGAIAIRSSLGLSLHGARVRVADADHAGAAPARDLGRLEVADGETRVELLADSPPRPLRSLLVYDPIGARLDQRSPSPSRDPALGASDPAPTAVHESFELARDAASAGLPGGAVRLVERRPDGSLAVLGEARLFDVRARDAAVDTIDVGTAAGITATRERRDLSIDDSDRRLREEFAITIDNQRARPAAVLWREHLYRGLSWHVPYPTHPVAAKEGEQQISLRLVVPAHGKASQTYVVVYTWDP